MRARWLVFVPLLSLACAKSPERAGTPAHAEATAGVKEGKSNARAMLEVHATLEVDVASVDAARDLGAALEAHAREVSGFVEQSNVGANGARFTVRVPPSDLPAIRAMLAGHGVVAHESVSAKDVTDAIMDVDARVRSAKTEETRLLGLLEKQTGSLADVLAVEKALADVRERIERLEAEQRGAHGRVDLATVEIVLHVSAGEDAPFVQRLAVAGREGTAFARDAAAFVTLTTVRATPTVLPLGLAAIALIRVARRKKSAQ